MPGFSPLSLADGQATPVAHTFTPAENRNGIATFEDRIGGIAVGFPVVTMSLKRPVKGSDGKYRIIQKVYLPTLEVTAPSTSTGIQPAPTKAYELGATVEYAIPQRSTRAERLNLHAFTQNLISSTVGKAMVVDYDGYW